LERDGPQHRSRAPGVASVTAAQPGLG
jgi:hypothetical protein